MLAKSSLARKVHGGILYTFSGSFNGANSREAKPRSYSRSGLNPKEPESGLIPTTKIKDFTQATSFQRVGSRIAQAIDSSFITAAKRGVIQNNRAFLSRLSRSIGDYSRDELIDTLLSVMGAVWWEREEAIRAASRHLGFKRTGSLIRDAFKSAINGAIRRGLIERDGQSIRKAK